mgnify:CR=1 FL=1
MNKKRKECVAMLLAGGQGSRLYALTKSTAKPAVTFGGKYRIIDFPLSNCINSGIDTVGVLTQYQPLMLNDYVGNGLPWDLDRTYGGVKILPPYQGQKKADWYKGTANAIYQNMAFIDQYDPEYVIILSGDHIYRMDYADMLRYHKKKDADCTIAVLEVPLKEASRFGILTTHDNGQIYKFTEKPKNPDSTKASMGIYIFNKKKLFEYLIADEADPNSANDFGKNIIPAMLAAGERMFAYAFDGYWKDVGTIASLWEANMDLLGKEPAFNIRGDERTKIYARNSALPSSYIDASAKVVNSFVAEGCEVYGTVCHSVVSTGCTIGEDAVVEDSVVMPGVVIESGAIVRHAILGEDSKVCRNAVVGGAFAPDEKKKISVAGKGVVIAENAVLAPGDML